jgi:hypothetical protein
VGEEARRVEGFLTKAEYDAARLALNARLTSTDVVKGMWQALPANPWRPARWR